MGSSSKSSLSFAATSIENVRKTVLTSAAWTEIFALRITFTPLPIQTTSTNFSRWDSLSFAYETRT